MLETAHELLEALRLPLQVDGIEIAAQRARSGIAAAAGAGPRAATSCCAARTSRCTRPSSRGSASPSTTRSTTTSPRPSCGSPRSCAEAIQTTASSSSGTSRRSTRRPRPVRPRGAGALAAPGHGLLVSPIAFLPAARRAGLMPAISDAVAELALARPAGLRAAGHVRVAINCAPPELLSGMFLPRLLAAAADSARCRRASLVVEVTEDVVHRRAGTGPAGAPGRRGAGLQISIDDYGTGFSSLAYLRDLPVDELKSTARSSARCGPTRAPG